MRDKRCAGFTLIEMMIVVLVSAPVMLAILSTTKSVGHSVGAADRAAEVSETVRKVAERVGRLLRSAKLATIRVRATAADVAASKAAAVGEWIDVTLNDPRSNLQFRSTTGKLSMNGNDSTAPRELEFVLDKNEVDNDVDDDGDGFIDEGKLWMRYESTRSVIADDVEFCSFQLDGQIVRYTLRCGRRDDQGRTYRESTSRVSWVRN